MTYLSAFLFSSVISLVGLSLVLLVFPKIGLMDRPERYGIKRNPIPYPAGVVIWLSFFLGSLFFLDILRDSTIGLLLGGSLVMVVSFYDDRVGLNPIFRLLVQILAAGILIYFHIGITHLNIPMWGVLDLTIWKIAFFGGNITVFSDLLTLFLIVLFTNSMNWLDGSPGLPSGISFIAATVLFLLAMRPGLHATDQTEFATLAIMLAGACAVFVFFDFPKPKLLMGDTGSMFLGFTLGTLAIISGGKLATVFLILGVPLVDAFLVIVRRIMRGQLPWKGDYTHIHHRLKKAGFSEKQTALIIYAIAALFGVVALFLHTEGKAVALIALLLFVVIGEVYLRKLRSKKALKGEL